MGVKLAEWFQCSEFCQNEGRSRSWSAGCKSRPPDGRQRGLSSVASTNPASLPRPPTREFHSMFNTSNIYVFTIPATAGRSVRGRGGLTLLPSVANPGFSLQLPVAKLIKSSPLKSNFSQTNVSFSTTPPQCHRLALVLVIKCHLKHCFGGRKLVRSKAGQP